MENKSLKLISLNTWGGRALHPLLHFIRQKAADTDIFCLQEVFDTDQAELDRRHPEEHVCGSLFKKIFALLPDFEGSFAYFDDNPHRQSLAIFVRRTVPIKTLADFIVYKPEKPQETGSAVLSSRKLQYVSFIINSREYTVVNFHGLWNAGQKTDTPERIEQSESIKKFLDTIIGPKILCGDFNLLPETRSLKILEQNMKNLIAEHGVKSTRTPLYRKHSDPNEPKFADYMLVSPEVMVRKFQVLDDLVSDHAPMFLEFS